MFLFWRCGTRKVVWGICGQILAFTRQIGIFEFLRHPQSDSALVVDPKLNGKKIGVDCCTEEGGDGGLGSRFLGVSV